MSPSVPSFLWGLILILEANSSPEYLSPRTCPCCCPPGRFKVSEYTDVSALCRHTLSSRVIQTSLCVAINEFFFFVFGEFTLASQNIPQSIPAHPELEKNHYNMTSRIHVT